jgi:hypothetical protein
LIQQERRFSAMGSPSEELSLKLPLSAFLPARLQYRYDIGRGCLQHNFARDLHMFVLWEHATPEWARIVEDLDRRFGVIHRRHVTWPEADVDDNFLRLYGSAPLAGRTNETVFRRKEIVGAGTFAIVVVEDRDPHYAYDRTYSRKVEIVNRRIAEAKATYREWTGGGFKVHSSNSLGEFFRDMTLLVGAQDLDSLLVGDAHDLRPLTVQASLAGAGGWHDLRELFVHLRRAARYVVLRNFESLPERLPDGDADIDALCDQPAELAAIANAVVRADRDGKFACAAMVAGNPVPLDLRWPGDGYFDAAWQAAVLADAVEEDGVIVPSVPDRFFTLLYHAKVHKDAVKSVYKQRLRSLAQAIGLGHYRDADLSSDEVAADMLGGYMASRGYLFTLPRDVWVGVNGPFVAQLKAHGMVWQQERAASELLAGAVLARMPLLWRWRRRLTRMVAAATRRSARWVSHRST